MTELDDATQKLVDEAMVKRARQAAEMSDYTRVSWYEHDCDWITKYCDDHHTRSALIPTAALAVLGDRDTLREKAVEAVAVACHTTTPWSELAADAVLDVLYGKEAGT